MKRGFSGLYVDQPEWSGGFLKRVRIAEEEKDSSNIMMGSGWVFFEPEGDDTYASVTSTWKVSDETRAQWDAEEREEERAYKEWYDGLSDKERAKYESEEEDEMELV